MYKPFQLFLDISNLDVELKLLAFVAAHLLFGLLLLLFHHVLKRLVNNLPMTLLRRRHVGLDEEDKIQESVQLVQVGQIILGSITSRG